MLKCKKSQSSTEYIILIGFLLVIITPLSLTAFDTFNKSKESLLVRQGDQAINLIISEAESVYYQGPPSMSKIRVYFPENVFAVNLSGYEASFKIRTSEGIDEIISISNVNITGNLEATQGIHLITVQTNGEYVVISE